MPTGYTCYIEEGKIDNAKDFLTLCLRNFGCCVSMRDDPMFKEIPEKFEVSEYYPNKVKELKESIDKVSKSSNEDFVEEINSCIERYKNKIEEDKKIQYSYEKILKQIDDWHPTEDYVGVKNFAINQIRISQSDSMTEYYEKEIEKLEEEKNNLDAYKAKKSKKLNEDLEYYSKQLKEETNRVNNRNKFLAGFREAIFEM